MGAFSPSGDALRSILSRQAEDEARKVSREMWNAPIGGADPFGDTEWDRVATLRADHGADYASMGATAPCAW